MWYLLLLLYVVFLVNTAHATCPALSYSAHPVAGGHCWSSEYGDLASGTVDECYNHCIGTSSPSGEPFVSFIHGKSGRSTENKCYCWADGPFADGCADWRTSSTDWNSYVINRVCGGNNCPGGVCSNVVGVVEDHYCSSFWGDDTYMELANNPRSTTTFSNEHCAKYCGYMIYNKGAYNPGDTIRHYVTNRKKDDSRGCFCHYTNVNNDCEISSNQESNDYYDILYIDTVVGVVEYSDIGDGYCLPDTYGTQKFNGQTFEMCKNLCENNPDCSVFAWHETNSCILDLDGTCEDSADGGADTDWNRYKINPHKVLTIGSGSDRGQCHTCDDSTQCASGLMCKHPSDLSHGVDYTWAHTGDCQKGDPANQEVPPIPNNGFSTLQVCADQCRGYSWSGKHALGFIYKTAAAGGPGCYCEAQPSYPHDDCMDSGVPNDGSSWQRYDFNSGWQSDYHFAHVGTCAPASGTGDIRFTVTPPPPSVEDCATACRGKIWDSNGNRYSKGFSYRLGECFCSSVHSYPHLECLPPGNEPNSGSTWRRYDFNVPYAFAHYGECRKDNTNHQIHLTADAPYSIESCASACKGETTPNGKKAMGFLYHQANDGCYCESQASYPHPDCEPDPDTSTWARYDFVNYSPVFEYKHDGRCQDGATQPYTPMLPLSGTDRVKASQCSKMCMGAMIAGRGARGFVVSGTVCECETYDSATECQNKVGDWKRYDFVSEDTTKQFPTQLVYETKGYCHPAGDAHKIFDNSANSVGTREEKLDNCRVTCLGYNPHTTHFTFYESGQCYCLTDPTSPYLHTEHPCEYSDHDASVGGSSHTAYTIWHSGAIPDVHGCDHTFGDIRGHGVCISPYEVGCTEGEICTSVEATFIDNVGTFKGTYLHPLALTSEGHPSYIFGVDTGTYLKMVRTDLDAIMRETRYIRDFDDLTKENWDNAVQNSNRFTVDGETDCVADHYCVKYFNVVPYGFPTGCTEGEVCTTVKATFVNTYSRSQGTTPHTWTNVSPKALTIDGIPTFIFGILQPASQGGSWFWMVRTDLDGVMREVRYIDSNIVSNYAHLTEYTWNEAVQNSNRFDVNGETTCVEGHYCVENFIDGAPTGDPSIDPDMVSPKLYTKVFDGDCKDDKQESLGVMTIDECHTECMGDGFQSFTTLLYSTSLYCYCERGTAWGAFDFNTQRGHEYPQKYTPYRCGDGDQLVQTGWDSYTTESYGTYFQVSDYDKYQAYCPAGKHHFNMTHCAQCPAGKYRPDEWRVTDGGCDGAACMLITESGSNGAGTGVCAGECDGGSHPASSSAKSTQCGFQHDNAATIDCFQRQTTPTAARAPIPGCAHVGQSSDWDYCYDTAIPEGNFNATECYDCPVGKSPTPTGDRCTVHPVCVSSETPLDGPCEYGSQECVEIALPIETLVLHMYDSYGDGWNSFYLTINNAAKTLSSYVRSGTTSIPSAANMVIAWQADGSYPSEVTWSLKCQDGTVVASGNRYGPWGTFPNPCPAGGTETQCTDTEGVCGLGKVYNSDGCSDDCAPGYSSNEVVGYVANDHNYCVKDGYSGALRPYANTDNPGTTFEEKREACFRACVNADGAYIQDSVTSYQDADFWDNFQGSDITHFIILINTVVANRGRCYCYTDGPSADECAADGAVSHTSDDYAAYVITRTTVCSNPCTNSPDPLTLKCSYSDYTCDVGDTYNNNECARNCSVGYVQSGEACGKCIGTEYQDEPGQKLCKECADFSVSSPDGASCVCEPGAAGSPCEVCLAGKFVSEVCESCPDGQYQDQDGQAGCKECADGSFVDADNTTCTVCPMTISKHDWGSGCPSWSTNDGCHCECGNSGFTGVHCDECGYGKGYNITTNRCENCTFGYVNTQDSHTAACALLGCDEDYGYTSDIVWDPANTSTNSSNCQECPTGSVSPAGDGQCVVTTCLENFRVWNYHCVACVPGKINAAGDYPYGPDTECDYTCGINEYYLKDIGCTPCSVPEISDGTKDTCWHQASKYVTDESIHDAVEHPEYYDNTISTSAVTNMDRLFKNRNITSADLEKMKGWDISSVTSMREMFLGAKFQDPGGPGKPFDPDDPDGLQWTIHSDVDKTRWKSPTVRYGLFNADADVIEVCPGMDVLVRWDVECDIQEAESQSIDSVENEVVSIRVSGTVQIMDNLFALPGKRRFFRCSTQGSAAFEVFCNADYNIRQYCNSFVGTVKNGTVLGESCALSNSGLRSLLQKWTADKIRIEEQHGPLSEWDVSYVTNMTELFKDSDENPDIRKWDMSNVVHAERMFQNSTFTYSIDKKDFSSLQSASGMFDGSYTGRACGKHLARAGAKSKLSITGANGLENCLADTNMHTVAGEWWTNRVNVWNTYGHIDDWDVTEVTNMIGLFKNKAFTTESLTDWQTGSVTDMTSMFENTNFNGDIRFWDVRKVSSFSRMFYNNAVFNYDLSRFEVFSKESTDMTNSRFYKQNVLQLDELYKEEVFNIFDVYAEWKTNKSGIEEVYGPISEWMVHSVLNMSGLFKDEDFNEDISRWVVSSVTDMSSMFEGSTFDQPIGGWSTVNVRNMAKMFKGTVFNQDIHLWNVTKVEDMTEMFANSVFSYSIGDWDLFATAADNIKAPREDDFCIVGDRSASTVLETPRGDPSATRDCYEYCDNLITTKRLDIEGRNRWRSWGRVIADINTSSLTEPYTTWHNFGIVTTSTENHTCTCLEEVGQISTDCDTTSEFQYVFQFRDMSVAGLFENNTAYRKPMCGLGWRYRDLSSMTAAQLESADSCGICGYDELHKNYSSGHGKTIMDCGLCVGEFRFDYCRPSLRSFTLKELYDFEKTYFRDYNGSLVVDDKGDPLSDYATDDEINDGYVNKFACNCMYKDGLQGCLVVNGRKQVRMKEWYAPGEIDFSDYIEAQGDDM